MDNLDEIIRLLREGDQFVQYRDEVTVVLGNAGSGKSATVQYLVGDLSKLEAKKVSDKLVVVSTDDQIQSSPFFPSLFTSRAHNVYDCSGFDVPTALQDLVATHYLMKLLRRAKSVKFVLVADYSSIVGPSKADILRLLRNAGVWVKKWSKFVGSTFLIATGVQEFDLDPLLKMPTIRPSARIIADMSGALLSIKKQLQARELELDLDEESLSNVLDLLDSLAIKRNDKPYSLSLFRTPNAEGPLGGRKEMIDDQQSAGDLIFTSLYAPISSDDLASFSIYPPLQLKIFDNITEEIKNIGDDIVSQPDLQAVHHLRAILELRSKLEKLDSKMVGSEVDKYLQMLVVELQLLKLDKSSARVDSILKHTNLLRSILNGGVGPEVDVNNLMKGIFGSLGVCRKMKVWEVFLIYLYTELSTLERQRARKMYDVKDLSMWSEGGTPGIFITANNVAQFIQKLKETVFTNGQELPDPNTITDSTLNDELRLEKLNKLNQVLGLTLKQEVVLEPVDNVITIKQNIILLSDVVKGLKEKNYDGFSLKLFASDRIFMNDGLSLPSCDVTLIAPFIEIVGGQQSILLRGLDKGAFQPDRANTGADGKAGESGCNGGNFLAVTMSSLEGLTVDTSGGKGQDGQGGGDGAAGEDGTDAPLEYGETCVPAGVEGKDWKILSEGSWGVIKTQYRIYARRKGYTGGNGGKGGNGGTGGNCGTFFAASSLVRKVQEAGKAGIYGVAGKGGIGGLHGRDRLATRKQVAGSWPSLPYLILEDNGFVDMDPKRANGGSVGANGEAGSVGAANNDELKLASDLSNYKLFSLENDKNVFYRRSIVTFNEQALHTDKLDPLYNTLALYNEMVVFEREYHRLRGAANLLSLYTDLLGRVARYSSKLAQNPKLNSETSQKSLQVLYTAVLSKVCSLKRGSQRTLVVDIRQYIKTTITQVKIFKQKKYTETLLAEKKEFGNKIKKRIDEAKVLIDTQLSKDIDSMIESTKVETSNLLKEVASLESDLVKQREALEKLKEQLTMAAMLGLLKNVSKTLDIAGPCGTGANAVIQAGTSLYESMNKIDKGPMNVASLPDAVGALNRVTEDAKKAASKRVDNLEKLIQDMQDKIDGYRASMLVSFYAVLPADQEKVRFSGLKSILTKLKAKVSGVRALITGKPADGAANDNLEAAESTLNDAENEIQEAVQTEANNANSSGTDKDKDKDKDEEEKKKKEEEEQQKVIDELVEMAKGFLVLKDAYSDFSSSMKDVQNAVKASGKIYDQLVELDQYGRQVREVMTPMLKNMGDDLKRVEKTLSEKSQVVLDVAKWKVQKKMKQFKEIVEKSTSGFKAQEKLSSTIVKLSEAITVTIGIYDRIENYKQQAELADYISNMNERRFGIDKLDGELGDSVREMRLMTQANIVLDRFEACVEAVKQWVFPFAGNFLGAFKLPQQLKPGQDVDTLIEDAVAKIDALNVHISDYYSTNQPDRTYIRSGPFDNTTGSPFFTWKNGQHTANISKLFSGEQVLLLADPALASSFKAAIKFNKIKLNFHVADKAAQDKLYSYLKLFNIQMTHMGNSYYRFKNKIYVIESNQIAIIYSISKENEPPVDPNDILTMLKKGDILLSPYAMWKIQLTKNLEYPAADFEQLKPFADKVDLELVGAGKYLDESFGGIPDLDLESFYTVDRVLDP